MSPKTELIVSNSLEHRALKLQVNSKELLFEHLFKECRDRFAGMQDFDFWKANSYEKRYFQVTYGFVLL